MFFVPGYVTVEHKDSKVYLTSNLLYNKVVISEYLEELEDILKNGCDNLSTPLTQFLHEQELLQNEQELRINLEQYESLMERDLIVTIMPTETCNFRCPYCYENHKPKTMREETIQGIESYIQSKLSDFQFLKVHWFGGEPTLCKDTVLRINHFIKKLQEKNDFKYYADMTTNGYLLDIDSFREYYDSGVTNYQITLDGWNHDKTRPHVSGKGTLDTILNNLKEISKLPEDRYCFNIIIRHNILSDDNDFTWYDHLKKLFGADKRFSLLVKAVGNWGGDEVKSLQLLEKKDVNSAVKAHIDYIKEIGMKYNEIGDGKAFSGICYANYKNSAVFRADGRIEKCTVCLDHPKNLMGYINQNSEVIWNEEMEKLWTESTIEEKCLKCPVVLSCLNKRCKKKELTEGVITDDCSYVMSHIY